MKYLLLPIVFVLGCGVTKHTEELITPPASVIHVARSGSCVTIATAKDTNYNGEWDSADSDHRVSSVCDGAAGSNGLTAYELAVAAGFNGTMSDWLTSLVGPRGVAGADGADGRDGEDGAPGPAGPQGPTGPMPTLPSGSVYPYKLCSTDNTSHPEYGFVVGTDIYAVYYGVVGGVQQAFFTKLNNGSYVTTNGAACTFTVEHNPNGDLIINGVVVVANPGSGPTPLVATGVFSKVSEWSGHVNTSLVISNTGTSTIVGWTLEFDLPSGQYINAAIGANVSNAVVVCDGLSTSNDCVAGVGVIRDNENDSTIIPAGSSKTVSHIPFAGGSVVPTQNIKIYAR